MENVNEIMLYQMWSGIILVFFVSLFNQIWKFKKKYPEIFKFDISANDPHFGRIQRIRDEYTGKIKLLVAMIFVWALGMYAIYNWYTPENKGVFVISIIIFSLLYIIYLVGKDYE